MLNKYRAKNDVTKLACCNLSLCQSNHNYNDKTKNYIISSVIIIKTL